VNGPADSQDVLDQKKLVEILAKGKKFWGGIEHLGKFSLGGRNWQKEKFLVRILSDGTESAKSGNSGKN